MFGFLPNGIYYISKRWYPILCSMLLHKWGHFFLDTQYLQWTAMARSIASLHSDRTRRVSLLECLNVEINKALTFSGYERIRR